MVGMKDPAREEKFRQYELVEQFFDRFIDTDGSFRGSVTPYVTSTEFKERLATDLKHLLRDRIGVSNASSVPASTPTPIWTGSPYPGLRPFTTDEAAIFFGRGREVDALIARLRDPGQRFLAVVGASGTGKSSLIRAGLIPRLHNGAIEGSQHWRVVTCTPGAMGDNPFLALASELVDLMPTQAQKRPIEIAIVLAKAPQRIPEYAVAPTGGAVLLFVDQLEELFTHAAASYRETFGALLAHTVAQPHLRVVVTLRADFLPQCAALPDLAPLLQAGTFILAPPGPAALADMIRKPAERAGLVLEDCLADEILKDAGTDPGALPLMAFCLEELYQQTASDHRLTVNAYDAFDRLRGAIRRRAVALLEELRQKLRKTEDADLDAVMPSLFRALVHIDAAGTTTRRRAFRDDLDKIPLVPQLITALIQGRLLLSENEKTSGRTVITLAHEALITEWPDLCDWLNNHHGQLQRIQKLLLSLAAPEFEIRRHTVKALMEIGPAAAEAVPALIIALGDKERAVREGATKALAQIGSAAVPALITALGDKECAVRQGAANALGQLGPAAAETVPALITALGDPDAESREKAAWVLKQIGPAAAKAVPALITALGDDDKDVRWYAGTALGRTGPAAAEAVPALITALGKIDAEEGSRWSAVEILGRIGPAAAEAVPALIIALGDADYYVRGSAAKALGRIGPAAVPALIIALGDADAGVRQRAAEALGWIGPAADAAVPALTTVLGDGKDQVREAATKALNRIQSPSPAANSD
jgi:HEAT repeat protein